MRRTFRELFFLSRSNVEGKTQKCKEDWYTDETKLLLMEPNWKLEEMLSEAS